MPGSRYCVHHMDRRGILLGALVGAIVSLLIGGGYRFIVPSPESTAINRATHLLEEVRLGLTARYEPTETSLARYAAELEAPIDSFLTVAERTGVWESRDFVVTSWRGAEGTPWEVTIPSHSRWRPSATAHGAAFVALSRLELVMAIFQTAPPGVPPVPSAGILAGTNWRPDLVLETSAELIADLRIDVLDGGFEVGFFDREVPRTEWRSTGRVRSVIDLLGAELIFFLREPGVSSAEGTRVLRDLYSQLEMKSIFLRVNEFDLLFSARHWIREAGSGDAPVWVYRIRMPDSLDELDTYQFP